MNAGEENKFNFLVCADCRGAGFREGKFCSSCKSFGTAMIFGGRVYYWGKYIDESTAAYEKFEKRCRDVLNLILILFGLSGLAVLVYFNHEDSFATLFSLKYWLTRSYEKLYFWITLLADLYLYYRLSQETSSEFQVARKKFNNQEKTPHEFFTWAGLSRMKNKDLIDVSLAFTNEANMAVQAAWELANHFGHNQVERIHFFGVLTQFDKSAIILARLGINFELFKQKISRYLTKNIISRQGNPLLSNDFHKMLLSAYRLAMIKSQRKVELTDLVSALAQPTDLDIKNKDDVQEILIDFDLNYQKIKNVVSWLVIQTELRENLSRFRSRARYKPKSGMDRAMTGMSTPILDRFSEDLTRQAKFNQFFPCLGREKEFERIFRIMEASRDGVLLVGNQGVGRTTILQGLAERMVSEDVPPVLRDKRLVSLNVASLLAGADAADAEERLLTISNEVMLSGNIVLAIENIHSLTGITVGNESSLDLAEVLAQIISKHLFYCLATTSPAEYVKALEGRSLDASFQKIKVEELDLNAAICVLEAKSGPIEYENKVYFSYAAIEKAAILSARYIHDRYLPAKAIEILEQAAIKVRQERGESQVITGDDVAVVISEMIKIPLAQVTKKESEKLLSLEDEIHKRMIGQEEAVKIVASALRRARAELREGKRPIASMLFLGPTGVGKTELAKTVSEVYFNDEAAMIRIDMSEYQEQSSVSRMIGSGSTPGVLTELVRKKPFALILFDEIEKAHPDILNLFLQVMDDGRLTNAQGITIDFTSTIIIMTSNVGASYIQDEINKGADIENIKNYLVNESLRQTFRPEFLNRFDGIVVFKPLTMVEVINIARLMLNQISKRLEEKGISFTATDEAIAELAELGFDQRFGARALRRTVQTRVDDILADYLLKGEIGRRDKVILEAGGKLRVEKAIEI